MWQLLFLTVVGASFITVPSNKTAINGTIVPNLCEISDNLPIHWIVNNMTVQSPPPTHPRADGGSWSGLDYRFTGEAVMIHCYYTTSVFVPSTVSTPWWITQTPPTMAPPTTISTPTTVLTTVLTTEQPTELTPVSSITSSAAHWSSFLPVFVIVGNVFVIYWCIAQD